MTLWEEIVDGMNDISGVHPGFRAAHAKGVVFKGTFSPTAEAAKLCRAPHFQGGAVECTARFSNGGGDPTAPDADRRDGKGLAVKFHLPDGEATDLVFVSIPVFLVRDEQSFLDFVRARKPDPETGEIDMEKIGAYLAEHPETAAALQIVLPTLVPPRSYATTAFNSLHAFRLTNADGEGRWVRYRWVPEAARLLRPGGRLIFLVNGLLLTLCGPDAEEPATDRLVRPYFGLHRLEWSTDASVNFGLGYGDWIRLLRSNGLDVEDLLELRPAEDATTDDPYVTLEWALQWPSEEVWKARKRG